MSLRAGFGYARVGNTIPYSALHKRGRTNAGFFDLRGSPEKVTEIHEATQSPALAALLRKLALSSKWMSLGCDIGAHREGTGKSKRYFSGGYIQFTSHDLELGIEHYQQLAERIADEVSAATRRCDWRLLFEIGEINYRLDTACWEPYAMWIRFWGAAPTPARAESRRERLLRAVTDALFRESRL